MLRLEQNGYRMLQNASVHRCRAGEVTGTNARGKKKNCSLYIN
jgi:hypothetical protein